MGKEFLRLLCFFPFEPDIMECKKRYLHKLIIKAGMKSGA